MKEKLETEHLITLSIKATDLVWIDIGSEAFINEKMFDVASYTLLGDSIQLTGLFDSAEDKLHAELQHLMQQKNGQQKQLVKLLHWQLFTHSLNDYSFSFYGRSAKNIHPYEMPFWVNCSSSIQKPPALGRLSLSFL